MTQLLVAALHNPQEGGAWYRLPPCRTYTGPLADRYKRTREALFARALVTHTSVKPYSPSGESYSASILTPKGIELAQALSPGVDWTGCVTFRPPPYSS